VNEEVSDVAPKVAEPQLFFSIPEKIAEPTSVNEEGPDGGAQRFLSLNSLSLFQRQWAEGKLCPPLQMRRDLMGPKRLLNLSSLSPFQRNASYVVCAHLC